MTTDEAFDEFMAVHHPEALLDVCWRRIGVPDTDEAGGVKVCSGLNVRQFAARLMRATKSGQRIEIISLLPSAPVITKTHG